jgi:DNA-binding HxlR family transcriptional regulator
LEKEMVRKTSGPICAYPGLRVRQIEKTLAMIRKKWSVRILLEVYYGSERFSEIARRIPVISNKVLSTRLEEMEKSHLIQKSGNSLRKYGLTAKGLELIAFLAMAGKFSMQHSD